MSRPAMPSDATEEANVTTEVIPSPPAWPFAETPERAEERAEHVEDLLDERPDLSGYDATVDASFPASDPPPGPTHIGGPR